MFAWPSLVSHWTGRVAQWNMKVQGISQNFTWKISLKVPKWLSNQNGWNQDQISWLWSLNIQCCSSQISGQHAEFTKGTFKKSFTYNAIKSKLKSSIMNIFLNCPVEPRSSRILLQQLWKLWRRRLWSGSRKLLQSWHLSRSYLGCHCSCCCHRCLCDISNYHHGWQEEEEAWGWWWWWWWSIRNPIVRTSLVRYISLIQFHMLTEFTTIIAWKVVLE